MKITYTVDGEEFVLTFDKGKWSGGKESLAALLNGSFSEWIGNYEYYPTMWHEAKAVADILKGTIDEPEPDVPNEPGVLY